MHSFFTFNEVWLARQGSNQVLILITPWNYPQAKPYARIAPFVRMAENEGLSDVFPQLWEESRVLKDPPDWEWNEDKYLIDYVHALEVAHDLRPPEPELSDAVAAAMDAINQDDDTDETDVAQAADDIDEETVP